MLKALRLVGSVAFVVGFFAVIFAGIPWVANTLDSVDLGGPLPVWLKLAVYLLIGGIALSLLLAALIILYLLKSGG